jgi:Holliday junction resolvase-like predicted endonuclease
MTDEELKELVASLAVAQRKTDEHIDSLLEAQKETDRKLKKVGDLVGNIGRNQGDVTEEFFFNSLANDAHLGSVHFDDITKNQHKQRGKFQEEYDIVMTNGEAVGIVEVKYKVHENDLKKLERKMQNFKKLFPIYEAYKLYGAIASFHINDDAKEAALNQGFFVLQRSGDLIHTDASENLLVL